MESLNFDAESPARECPKCGHAADVPPRKPSWLRSVLGLKPLPAECPADTFDMSGVGSEPCMCRHPAHGS